MTTIAYKDGVIAYDSLSTSGGLITNDDFDKKYKRSNVFFFLSGSICEFDNLMDCYFGAEPTKTNDSAAFVYDSGNLYLISVCINDGFWKQKLNPERHYSIGSGSNFALAAMDLGYTAVDAIKQAIKRDCYSGGKIKTFKFDIV